MRRFWLIPLILLFSIPSYGFRLTYKEQIYELYHRHLYAAPERSWENIKYLEEALKAPFANPLNARTPIETKKQWEKYRLLFDMHLHLKLCETYLVLGSKFDKRKACFFNAPYRDIILRSLNIAEKIYQFAIPHWEEAEKLAKEAGKSPFIYLEDIQYWEDESYRINHGNLNYGEIIQEELERLRKVRAELEAMDENTFGGPGAYGVADPDEAGELRDLFKDWEGFIQ